MMRRLSTVVALLCATTVPLTAQYRPTWENHFEATDRNTENNLVMTAIGSIDGIRCDSAFEIGVFIDDVCRLTVPLSSTSDFYAKHGYYSRMVIRANADETIRFRFYDHRNKAEVKAEVCPQEIPFVADAQYGSFNTELYELAFERSTTHRTTLLLDDTTDLPFTDKQYSITSTGIACSYTRKACMDGSYESVVLPFDADVTELSALGFVFEKFEGLTNNTLHFVGLSKGERLYAGISYIYRYAGTPSDGHMTITFCGMQQQVSDAIHEISGWTGTFVTTSGSDTTGKYLLSPQGDKIQEVGSGASLSPYHAYLSLPHDADAATYTAVHREAGIKHPESEVQRLGTIYDLQGRKVTIPTHGIYIKNGRAVVIK